MAIQLKRTGTTPTDEQLSSLADGQPLVNLETGDMYIGGCDKKIGQELVEAEATTREAFDNLHNNLLNGTGLGAVQSISSDPEALNEASGNDAVAIGKGCVANNKRAVAIGNGCKSHANTSIVVGQVNTANENANAVFVSGNGNITDTTQGCVIGYLNKDNGGRSNVVLGRNNAFNKQGSVNGPSVILGMSNTLNTGDQNIVIGTGNRIGSGEWDNWGSNPINISNQTLIGQYLKVDYASSGSTRTILGRFNKNRQDSVFEFGAGNADTARYNAIEVLNDKTLRLFGAKAYSKGDGHLFSVMDSSGLIEAIDITSTDPSNIKIDLTRDDTITQTDIIFAKTGTRIECGEAEISTSDTLKITHENTPNPNITIANGITQFGWGGAGINNDGSVWFGGINSDNESILSVDSNVGVIITLAPTRDNNPIRLKEFNTHTSNTGNPHAVTKEQVGLSEVANKAQTPERIPNSDLCFTSGGAYALYDSIRDQLPKFTYSNGVLSIED